jgi:hypothetical protein
MKEHSISGNYVVSNTKIYFIDKLNWQGNYDINEKRGGQCYDTLPWAKGTRTFPSLCPSIRGRRNDGYKGKWHYDQREKFFTSMCKLFPAHSSKHTRKR